MRIVFSAARIAPFALLLAGCPSLAAPAVTLSATTGHPRATTQVSGTDFSANEAVDIYFDTTDVILEFTNGAGNFGPDNLQIPATALPGSHWITAIGRKNGDGNHRAFIVTTPWLSHGYDARGHRRNPFENVIDSTNAGNLELAWTGAMGAGTFSSPAVFSVGNGNNYNPFIFVGSEDHKFYAFDKSGNVRWTARTSGVVDSSPAIGPDGTVYVGSTDHGLYAFKPAGGSSAWPHPAITGGAINSSPAVANGIVYVGSDDAKLYAFDAVTGAAAWAAPASLGGAAGFTTPAVAGGGVFVGAHDGQIYGFDAKTGAPLWPPVATGGETEFSGPAAANGFVYIGSFTDHKLYAVFAKSGVISWSFTAGNQIASSPAVANNTVYVGANDGVLYAIRQNDGSQRWSVKLGDQMAFCSPTVANGVVYVCVDSDMRAVDASTGAVLWTQTLPGLLNSSPAVSDGAVYIPDRSGNLYAFALDAGNNAVYKNRKTQPPSFASLHPDFRLKPMKR